jgi:hypothetical protein
MSKKKTLLTIGVVFLILVLFSIGVFTFLLIPNIKKNPGIIREATAIDRIVNSVSYVMISELKTEAEQKEIWERAMRNIEGKEVFEIEIEIRNGKTEGIANIKADGEDFAMYFDIGEIEQKMGINIVRKGDFVYFSAGKQGFQVKAADEFTNELEIQFGFKEFRNSFYAEEWEEEHIVYKGLETIDGRKYHTYYSNANDTLTWIDALAILPVKFQEADGTTGFIFYHSVEIETPVGYEDISDLTQEEKSLKLFELFFSDFNFEDEDSDFEYDYDSELGEIDWDYNWD